MATLDARLKRLESERPTENVLDIVLQRFPPLTNGAIDWNADHPTIQTFAPFFAERGAASVRFAGRFPNPADAGLADVLATFHETENRNLLTLERYRGMVPDAALAAIYGTWRNYAGAAELRSRVRELAGCIDVNGNLRPGYVLADNGCILDAPAFPDPQGHA